VRAASHIFEVVLFSSGLGNKVEMLLLYMLSKEVNKLLDLDINLFTSCSEIVV
jgi:hypothetical protein